MLQVATPFSCSYYRRRIKYLHFLQTEHGFDAAPHLYVLTPSRFIVYLARAEREHSEGLAGGLGPEPPVLQKGQSEEKFCAPR